ncbi:MAG: DUF5362 family protein [Bacteroidota bacterium]
MEHSTLDNDFRTDSELTIDPASRAFLKETSKWAKFLAIVGFVFTAIIVIGGLAFGSIMSSFSSELDSGMPAFGGGMISVMYILIALLYFMPILYLYRFATKMQIALARDDQFELTSAFENLKSTFKFIGILTLIMLGFYALTFLGALVFGTLM